VPEAVVDQLETVEVDEQHAERAVNLRPPGALHRHLQAVEEEAAVGQVGQRIVEGVVDQALPRPRRLDGDGGEAGRGLDELGLPGERPPRLAVIAREGAEDPAALRQDRLDPARPQAVAGDELAVAAAEGVGLEILDHDPLAAGDGGPPGTGPRLGGKALQGPADLRREVGRRARGQRHPPLVEQQQGAQHLHHLILQGERQELQRVGQRSPGRDPLHDLVLAFEEHLGAVALGDVHREDDDADDAAGPVAVRDLVGAHPALLAGAGGQQLHDAELRPPGAEHLLVILGVAVGFVGIDVGGRAPLDLVLRQADRVRGGLVDPQDAPFRILEPDQRRHGVPEDLHLLDAVAKLLALLGRWLARCLAPLGAVATVQHRSRSSGAEKPWRDGTRPEIRIESL
jgi:hypothetical protein